MTDLGVIDSAASEDALLGNEAVKQLRYGRKEIPIQCKIGTGNERPIQWSRPIRSIKDREEF
ncbi:hypothetical protein ENBRE01_2064 [Enteropsectra breve]|nr:hypothetical protein ENBRE01_2064 [Enteropsectra breve]